MPELDVTNPRLDLFRENPRVEGSMNGSAFGSSIGNMPSGPARELAIYQQLSLGNIPEYLRRGLPVQVTYGEHTGVFWMMPDFLSIGDDDDFLRMPMMPTTATKAAALFNAVMPTRKMVTEFAKTVAHTIPFQGFSHLNMSAVTTFRTCNARIQKELGGKNPAEGVYGPMKLVIIARGRPRKNVAIWGGLWANGNLVQGPPIQMVAHTINYLDYSHGTFWAANMMLVNDELMYVEDVLQHPTYWGLLSDEGLYAPIDTRYQTA